MIASLRKRVGRWIAGEPAKADRMSRKREWAQAFYEAAGTHRVNENLWDKSGNYDVNAALLPDLVTLRNRAKFECAHNGYALGVSRTYANDLIGRAGPTLQVVGGSKSFVSAVESAWREWSEYADISSEDHFCDVLRMQVEWFFPLGEFFTQYTKDSDARTPVKFRISPINPELVDTPSKHTTDDDVYAGVKMPANKWGKATEYYVLKQHPGAYLPRFSFDEFSTVTSQYMRHVFLRQEPRQARGVPWFAPTLESFAHLRQYTNDTLLAARVSAMLAGFIESATPPGQLSDPDADLPIFDMEPMTVTTLPDGKRFTQTKPEQPPAKFSEFKREMLCEAGRPVSMPWLRIGCDASGHTFSSARLDLNAYWSGINVIRGWIERRYLTRLFREWLTRWMLATNKSAPRSGYTIEWVWEPTPSVDPKKESEAERIQLQNGTISRSAVIKSRGGDPEAVDNQRAEDAKRAAELGISDVPQVAGAANDTQNEDDDDE